MALHGLLDVFCDLINPLLVLVVLYQVAVAGLRHRFKTVLPLVVTVTLGLPLVYGLLFIDQLFGIWSRAGIDYSTHTAFAMVMCSALNKVIINKYTMWLILSGYLLLILIQGYHSASDLLATGSLIVVILYGINRLEQRESLKACIL